MTHKLSEIDFLEVSRILDADAKLDYEVDPDLEDEGADPPPPHSIPDAAEIERLVGITD